LPLNDDVVAERLKRGPPQLSFAAKSQVDGFSPIDPALVDDLEIGLAQGVRGD